ncbi:uncharacterized protein [Lepeophtheirus salmonis]|nr:uncharacterized protein LOC121132025 isoform X2 [Lepeophtheirus salmonis]
MEDGTFTQRFSQDSGTFSQSLLSDYPSTNSTGGYFPSDPRRPPLQTSLSGRPRFGLPPHRASNAHVHALLTELRSDMDIIPKSLNNAVEAGTNFLSSGLEETNESIKLLREKAIGIEESLTKLDSQENTMSKIINSQLEIKEALLELSKTVEKQGFEIDRMNSQMDEIINVIKKSNTKSPSILMRRNSPAIVRRGINRAILPRFRRSLLDS